MNAAGGWIMTMGCAEEGKDKVPLLVLSHSQEEWVLGIRLGRRDRLATIYAVAIGDLRLVLLDR